MLKIPPKPIKEYSLFVRLLFFFQKKKYGTILEPMLLWGRIPQVMRPFLSMNRALNRKLSPLDPQLRALVCVKVSQINTCPFCIDLNSAMVLKYRDGQEKLNKLKEFEFHLIFTSKEKIALRFAELITASKPIEDAVFQELKKHFDEDAIVELTALIAFQNMSSKFNSALDVASYGFIKS
jgi:alkylhydroperoxidase family enzyme